MLFETFEAVQLDLIWGFSKADRTKYLDDAKSRLLRSVKSHVNYLTHYLSKGSAELKEKSFLLLCDILITFNSVYRDSGDAMGELAFVPSEDLVNKMTSYFENEMEEMGQLNEEDEENLESIRKVDFIAGFGKLVIFHPEFNLKQNAHRILSYLDVC